MTLPYSVDPFNPVDLPTGLTVATTTCERCPTSTTECAPGWTWPLYTGACVACGRPSRTSAACGLPHCGDCAAPILEPVDETEEEISARIGIAASTQEAA